MSLEVSVRIGRSTFLRSCLKEPNTLDKVCSSDSAFVSRETQNVTTKSSHVLLFLSGGICFFCGSAPSNSCRPKMIMSGLTKVEMSS
jgi:hypothetical protein